MIGININGKGTRFSELIVSYLSRACVVAAVMLATMAPVLAATTPSSGTVSPSLPQVTFTGGPFTAPNPSTPLGTTPPVCTDQTCGVFALTINIPSSDTNLYDIK